MPVIRNADSRRTRTPNGVMTTLASPGQGDAGLSVWRVEMPPGAVGPRHAFDTEQVWTVVDGGATIETGGDSVVLAAGDTIVLPPDAPRQVFAAPDHGVTAIAAATAGTRAYAPGIEVDPACAMPAGEGRLAPAWVV